MRMKSRGGQIVVYSRKDRAAGGMIATRAPMYGRKFPKKVIMPQVTAPVTPNAQQAIPTGRPTRRLALTFTIRYSEMARLIDRVISRIAFARSGEKLDWIRSGSRDADW